MPPYSLLSLSLDHSSLPNTMATNPALPDIVDTTKALLNVNMVNITKLTSTNFMTWSLQIHALLDGSPQLLSRLS